MNVLPVSLADRQEAPSVYWPAGNEEQVPIKSACEVGATRWFRNDKSKGPERCLYQLKEDAAGGLRQRRKMKGLLRPIFLSIFGSKA